MTVGLLPTLTEEQAMLVDTSVRFMEAECPMSAVRSRFDGAGNTDEAYRYKASELGWFGMFAGEENGGGSTSGNGLLDAALIAAERGARLQPGPFVGHSLAVHSLATGPSRAHADVLADLVHGRGWATWVFDPNNSCELRAAGDELRLHGAIDAVADCNECTWMTLEACGPEGLAQVLLPLDTPGVTIRRAEGFDLSRSWSRAEFQEVRVKADDLLAPPGLESENRFARQAQMAAVLSAAESVGAMHADFEMALQYSKDRIAFGRPIGSFQAIKHLLADTSLWLEMSKGVVAAAATALGSEAPDGPELAHAAKAFVAEKSVDLFQNCFQVFGGIGYTWEHDQHLYLRRLAADGECFGSPAWHRARMLEVVGVNR